MVFFTGDETNDVDNPYSFKKFLKGDVRSTLGGLTTFDLAHDLPDFRHDPLRLSSDSQLPDFALQLDSSAVKIGKHDNVENLPTLALDEPIGNSLGSEIATHQSAKSAKLTVSDDCDSDSDFSSRKVSVGGLPDFLSDSALNKIDTGIKNGLRFNANDASEDFDSELIRVSFYNNVHRILRVTQMFELLHLF